MNSTLSVSAAVAITVLIGALLIAFSSNQVAFGSAPSGLPATVATSSNPAVSTSASLLFATSSATCAARIISTNGDAIRLYFSDAKGQRPTNALGHLQLASTTQVYDGGQYGCNAVYVYSYSAQTITVTETR